MVLKVFMGSVVRCTRGRLEVSPWISFEPAWKSKKKSKKTTKPLLLLIPWTFPHVKNNWWFQSTPVKSTTHIWNHLYSMERMTTCQHMVHKNTQTNKKRPDPTNKDPSISSFKDKTMSLNNIKKIIYSFSRNHCSMENCCFMKGTDPIGNTLPFFT